jgi:hypothetical protein
VSILRLIYSVELPALPELLIPTDPVKSSPILGARIRDTAFMGMNLFGTDPAQPESKIDVHELTKYAFHHEIIEELGDLCEISRSQFFTLLSDETNEGRGKYILEGGANIAYVRNPDDQLVSVFGSRRDNNPWTIGGLFITRGHQWSNGYRVFSRSL